MNPIESFRRFLSVPLLWRELTQLAARKRTYFFRVLYGAIVLSVAWVAFRDVIELGSNPGFDVMGKGKGLFRALVVCQYSVVYVFVPAYCAGLITGEKERDTLQVMFTTKLGPWSIVIEKLMSRLLPFAFLVLTSVPILTIAYNYGGISPGMIWQSGLFLMLATLQVAAIAILCSTYFQRTVSSFVATYVLCGLFFYVIPAIRPTEIDSTVQMTEAPLVSDISAFTWHAPWTHQSMILAQPMSLEYVVVMSATILGSALMALVLARVWLIPRATGHRRSLLRAIFSGVDRSIEATTGVKLSTGRLPEVEPVAWRETSRGVIGNTRYQLYLLGVGTAVIIGLALACYLGDIRSKLATIQVVAFILGTLAILAKGTSLLSGERAGQTLEALLTTPLTNRDLMLQKYRGLRNLIAVLLIIYLQLTCLYAWEMHSQVPGMTLAFGGGPELSRPDFDPYLFVFCQIGILVIYPQMIAWLSVIIGMTFRRSLVALTIALICLILWCLVPVIALLLYDAFVGAPDNASLFLVSCPLFVPTLNLADSWGDRPAWVLALTNAGFYSIVWFFLRSHALTMVERKLGRRDENSWVHDPTEAVAV